MAHFEFFAFVSCLAHKYLCLHNYNELLCGGGVKYRIAGNFCGKIFVVFVVEQWTTNILPMNEATLPTFTCIASSNHENISHELTNIAEPRIF